MKEKIINKLLCLRGYHSFTWTLKQSNGICEPITGKIPARAVCSRCNKTFK